MTLQIKSESLRKTKTRTHETGYQPVKSKPMRSENENISSRKNIASDRNIPVGKKIDSQIVEKKYNYACGSYA